MRRADWFIRFICNSLFVYFLIEHISLISVGIVLAVMAIYLLMIHQMVKRKPMNWEYLIAEEGKKMMLLYRIANMFVDVPALKERVARRKWLDFVLSIIGEKRTYLYLYTRTFLRSGNYFGLYIRLLAIGGILLYFIPFLYGRFIVSIVFFIFNRLSATQSLETSSLKNLAGLISGRDRREEKRFSEPTAHDFMYRRRSIYDSLRLCYKRYNHDLRFIWR